MSRKNGASFSYVPPLGFRWLTPCYDLVTRLLVRDTTLKTSLLDEVSPQPGEKLLDLGCGTGTFILLLKRRAPHTHVEGIDLDERALTIARRKIAEANLDITLHHGSITHPQTVAALGHGTFDGVVSSLVFHHLKKTEKLAAMREILRLLKPGGRFILADWGPMDRWLERVVFYPVRLLDGFETTADNVTGRLPLMLEETGFVDVEKRRTHMTLFGPFTYYCAWHPKNERSRSEDKSKR